jgi:hypothetical protein
MKIFKQSGPYISLFLLWVGLHFLSSSVTWRDVLGIGIICFACALLKILYSDGKK